MTAYLEVTQEAGRAFSYAPPAGPVVMLNLPRFRAVADDAAHPQLAPPAPISGEVLFIGSARAFPIGPESERRNAEMRVRQRDAQAFLAFASDPACMAGTGHRVAAPEDSRLLPPTEGP